MGGCVSGLGRGRIRCTGIILYPVVCMLILVGYLEIHPVHSGSNSHKHNRHHDPKKMEKKERSTGLNSEEIKTIRDSFFGGIPW